MVRNFLIALTVAPFLSFSASAFGITALRDSVGIERKNGKLFVQHKVDPKETLYALSRKYNVTVAQIVEANPSVENSIQIGQIVLIPRKSAPATPAVATAAVKNTPAATPAATTTAAPASSRTFTVNDKGDKLHVVEARQTLYAISRMHGISVEDIKRWNNLTADQVNVGTSLVVGKGVAEASKKPIYVPEADDEATSKTVAATAPATPATTVANPPAAVPVPTVVNERNTDEDDEDAGAEGVRKIVQSGIAEMIDPKTDTNKYLALHKTAPVGTIMQIKNAMNGQVVYVRVIGKLPDTGTNNGTIVRISKKAYQKLGAVDSKFRVELSYMP